MKLLILLILVGAVAWLAPAPLSHVEGAVEIAASRDRVWTILSDVSSARLWDREMRELTITSTAKTGTGTARFARGAVGPGPPGSPAARSSSRPRRSTTGCRTTASATRWSTIQS